MGHVEAQKNCSLKLGATFATNLVKVGVVKRIVNTSGEATISSEKRRCVSHWSVTKQLVFCRDGERHADVLASVASCCFAGPWSGNEQ